MVLAEVDCTNPPESIGNIFAPITFKRSNRQANKPTDVFCVTVLAEVLEGLQLGVTKDFICMSQKTQEDWDALAVFGVTPGSPLDIWNRGQPPDHQIQTGDQIIEANGVSGNPRFVLEKVNQSISSVTMHLRRGKAMNLRFKKVDDSLGLQLNYAEQGMSLLVQQIEDGPVAEWNRVRRPGEPKVQIGDHLVEVNGYRGPSVRLLEALRQAPDDIDLVVVSTAGTAKRDVRDI